MTIPGGTYKHYKGPRYRVHGEGRHSETDESYVIYETLYDCPESRFWIRPKAMFEEKVVVGGQKVPRFAPEESKVLDPVVRQLQAYNARDIDAFCACFSEDIVAMSLGGSFEIDGLTAFREWYGKLFAENPNLRCLVDRRTVINNTVVDDELVFGHPRGDNINVVAIYRVDDGLISRVWFVA